MPCMTGDNKAGRSAGITQPRRDGLDGAAEGVVELAGV